MESIKEGLDKKSWFESMHKSAPSTDWKKIELQNTLSKYKNSIQHYKGDFINLAGGNVIGKWSERGSVNQSGSILKTAYNRLTQKLYAISDGGSMWQSRQDGFNWEVVEDQLRFDGRFLEIVYPSGQFKIISSIQGIPYFSTGMEWQRATGIPEDTEIIKNKDITIINDGKDIFYLSKLKSTNQVVLFHSSDFGSHFVIKKIFSTNQLEDVAMSGDRTANTFYMIEKVTSSTCRVLRWNSSTNSIETINNSTTLSYGLESEINLKAAFHNNNATFYITKSDKTLWKSSNLGSSWISIIELDHYPWEPGIFVSNENPNVLMYGAVHLYRSDDGGYNWERANHWQEYYGAEISNLHADIMNIEEFKDEDGHFITVSTHGGIYTSDDLGATFANRSLDSLNVSQYYDVKTYPADNKTILAASQDQGIQRSYDFLEGLTAFDQFYSGDFGHITFTNNQSDAWAVFPGGRVTYFNNPITFDASQPDVVDLYYDINSTHESVFIPPMIKNPYDDKSVLVAGGSIHNGPGAYIIEIAVNDFGNAWDTIIQWPYNFNLGQSKISALAYNPLKTNEIYVATNQGDFYRSIDSGHTFSQTEADLATTGNKYATKILCSEINDNEILLAGSGYSNAAVYYSEDSGQNFSPMIDGLPLTTVFDLAHSPDEKYIFAATEAGPYLYSKELQKWFDMAGGLAPNQRYTSVEYEILTDDFGSTNEIIRFGTFGRGIWDFSLEGISSNQDKAQANAEEDVYIFPNPATDYISTRVFDTQMRFTIVNSYGQQIFTGLQNAQQNSKIDISLYPNGIYYIIFEGNNYKKVNSFIKI